MTPAPAMQRPARPADWSDHHSGPIRAEFTTARAALEYGFQNTPGWFDVAMQARNRVVGVFGLQTEAVNGETLMAHLPILRETPETYEIGIPDKHLTFTITAELMNLNTRMTTSIWFNHWSGKLYLAAVILPHKIVVKQMLRGLE